MLSRDNPFFNCNFDLFALSLNRYLTDHQVCGLSLVAFVFFGVCLISVARISTNAKIVRSVLQ